MRNSLAFDGAKINVGPIRRDLTGVRVSFALRICIFFLLLRIFPLSGKLKINRENCPIVIDPSLINASLPGLAAA